VAHTVTEHFWVDPCVHGQRGAGVADVVQTDTSDARPVDDSVETSGQRVWMQSDPFLANREVAVVRVCVAEDFPFAVHKRDIVLEVLRGEGVQCEGTATCGRLSVRAFNTTVLDDASVRNNESFCFEIEEVALNIGQFRAPYAGGGSKHPQSAVPVFESELEPLAQFLCRP